jgi:hypothetical protein
MGAAEKLMRAVELEWRLYFGGGSAGGGPRNGSEQVVSTYI